MFNAFSHKQGIICIKCKSCKNNNFDNLHPLWHSHRIILLLIFFLHILQKGHSVHVQSCFQIYSLDSTMLTCQNNLVKMVHIITDHIGVLSFKSKYSFSVTLLNDVQNHYTINVSRYYLSVFPFQPLAVVREGDSKV